MTDEIDMIANDTGPNADPRHRRASLQQSGAEPAGKSSGGYTRYDITSLSRQRNYQAEIERASALLCKVQPDLVAGELVPVQSVERVRSRLPLAFTVGAITLFWAVAVWLLVALI